MYKKYLIILAPLLLLILIPFNIPLSIFYHTLSPYGTINSYLIMLAISGSGILFFDVYINDPEFREKHSFLVSWIALILTSLLVRFSLFNFKSNDYIEALSTWFDFIKDNGGFIALKHRDFSDYNSLYLYLTAFLTYLPIHKLYSIKLLSVFFDYLGAIALYKIVRLKHSGQKAFFSAIILLFTPTVLFNGALWAQCDMAFTAFLIWSFYFLAKEQPSYKKALIFFSISLMFKLQAVFFVLPFAFLYTQRKISLKYFLIVPIIWVLTILPNVIIGREFFDLLLVYARQIVRYPSLTYYAPSLYNLLPNAPFAIFNAWGILITFSFVLITMLFFVKHNISTNRETLVRLAFISVLVIPFLLPRMHERYFFAADIFAILYVFYVGRLWYVALIMNLVSLFSYIPFLFKAEVFDGKILSLAIIVLICIASREFWDYFFKQSRFRK